MARLLSSTFLNLKAFAFALELPSLFTRLKNPATKGLDTGKEVEVKNNLSVLSQPAFLLK